MTKEEILKKIDEKVATKQDLFLYYGIKNEESLEFALEEKFKVVTESGDFLSSTFPFIYEARKQEVYNPIQEMYIYYVMVLKGLYNVDSDELKILAGTIGAFKAVMLLSKILDQKEEVIFFKKLLKEYVERVENVYFKLNQILASINKILTDFNPEQLEKFSGDLQKALGNLKLDNN